MHGLRRLNFVKKTYAKFAKVFLVIWYTNWKCPSILIAGVTVLTRERWERWRRLGRPLTTGSGQGGVLLSHHQPHGDDITWWELPCGQSHHTRRGGGDNDSHGLLNHRLHTSWGPSCKWTHSKLDTFSTFSLPADGGEMVDTDRDCLERSHQRKVVEDTGTAVDMTTPCDLGCEQEEESQSKSWNLF